MRVSAGDSSATPAEVVSEAADADNASSCYLRDVRTDAVPDGDKRRSADAVYVAEPVAAATLDRAC